MKRQLLIALMASFLIIPQTALALEATYPQSHPAGIFSYKEGPMAKAGYHLFRAFSEYGTSQQKGVGPFKPSNPLVRFSRGRILIDATSFGDTGAMLDGLKGLGLHKSSRYRSVVSGWLPLGILKKVVAMDSLRSISASLRPITHVGLVTSEGDAAMYGEEARTAFGVDGTGVTVGVISDSYDAAKDAATDIANDDLPPGVTVLDDLVNGSDEGRAMMQIIHDVAPGADLAFHTAFNGMADFASGIVELADAGSDVIVDDVIYFAEPMFQDGIIAQAIDEVTGNGVAYFSSAGNQARNSYEADYAASDELLSVGGDPRGMLHDFSPDPDVVDWRQAITIPANSQVIIALQWDSPFGASANDIDIYLVDDNMIIWAESISDNVGQGGGDPVEILQFSNVGGFFGPEFHIMITHYNPTATPAPGIVKYVLYKDWAVTVNEHTTDSSTLYGHANANGAEAVGAAFYQQTPAFGQSPPLLEYFSSAGGTPILFDADGNPTSELRLKPEIVAPDGGNTTFFYSDTALDDDDWPNFFGTSAAAPHAAGLAALLLSHTPFLAPAEIYGSLESTAVDMNEPGFDYDSGYGLIQADLALSTLGDPSPPLPEAIPPVAAFSYKCSGTSCLFDASASTDDGEIVSYSWNFGDSAVPVSADEFVDHDYGKVGTYTVNLEVTDDWEKTAIATASVRVKKKGVSEGSSAGAGDGGDPVNNFCQRRPDHPKCR